MVLLNFNYDDKIFFVNLDYVEKIELDAENKTMILKGEKTNKFVFDTDNDFNAVLGSLKELSKKE